MAFTNKSTLGEIFGDPKAAAIMEKHMPGISENPMLRMGLAMTIERCSRIGATGIGPHYDAILADFAEIG